MSWRNPSTSQYFAWISELSQYNFVIEHRKGEKHVNADVMSRLYHDKDCKQCEVKYVTAMNKDDISTEMIAKLLNISAKEAKKLANQSEIEIVNNKLIFKESDNNERKVLSRKDGQVLAEKIHQTLNHIGQKKLICLVKKNVFWLNQTSDCKNVCSSCIICLKRKSLKSLAHSKED